MSTRTVLFLGSSHSDVRLIVERLRTEGFWDDPNTPAEFTAELEDSIRYFQRTHLGPDGNFLAVDGVVGEQTWWALHNSHGSAQRSRIAATAPVRLGPLRARILEVALEQHARGVAEQPDGSNRGPEIDDYLPDAVKTAEQGPAWCCYFYSWVVKRALGHWPLETQLGSCRSARVQAGRLQLYIPENSRADRPLPGDAFVMDRGGGHGHIGFVLRLSEDRRMINTVEGNCGNRVKVGMRWLDDPEIVGFVDNVPSEAAPGFELGVAALGGLGREATR